MSCEDKEQSQRFCILSLSNIKQKGQSLSGTESSRAEGLNSIISGELFGLFITVRTAENFTNVTYTVFQTPFKSPFLQGKFLISHLLLFPHISSAPSPESSSDLFQNPCPISEGRFWVKSPWWSVWQWVESAQWCNGCRVEVSAATQVDSPGPYRVIIMATGIMATVTMGVMVSTAVVVDVLLLPPVGPQRVTKHLHRNM